MKISLFSTNQGLIGAVYRVHLLMAFFALAVVGVGYLV